MLCMQNSYIYKGRLAKFSQFLVFLTHLFKIKRQSRGSHWANQPHLCRPPASGRALHSHLNRKATTNPTIPVTTSLYALKIEM